PDVGRKFPVVPFLLPNDHVFAHDLLRRLPLSLEEERPDLACRTISKRLDVKGRQPHPLELLSAFLPEGLNRVSTSDQRRAGRQHHRVVGIHGRHGRRVASIEGLGESSIQRLNLSAVLAESRREKNEYRSD